MRQFESSMGTGVPKLRTTDMLKKINLKGIMNIWKGAAFKDLVVQILDKIKIYL